MPNIKSAKKRMRTSMKRAERNQQRRSQLRSAIKKVRTVEDPEAAQAALRRVTSLLDRAAARRLIHPNKAARLKSQLSSRVDSLTSA